MPSYRDVLLVIKDGDAESAAVAAYFQTQRQIPEQNVLTLPLSGSLPTVEARDAFISGIRDHLVRNGLQDQINYIVLSANFPRECKDTSAGNAIFDAYLMWALSDTFPSTSATDCVPLRRNPYFYLRTPNYETRDDIKFTRSKYRFYLVSRLDGEGEAVTKQLIDNSGHPAYDQYRHGINFLVDETVANWSIYGYGAERTELQARGITIHDWDSTVSGTVHNVRDLNFAFLDWVAGPADAYQSYRNINKHLEFRPGALVFCYRSYPTQVFKRPSAGLGAYDPATGLVRNLMRSDASDLALQQMSDVAFVSQDETIWCALGQDVLKMSSTPNPSSANHYRGNGVAVYSADGTLLHHFTEENTAGGLLSDAVYRVTYDPYHGKVWLATFKGVCAYALATGVWERPAGLSSDKPAPVCQIYVDPTTSGQYLYVTFTAGATGCTPDIADHRSVVEYEVPTGTLRRYKFHGDDMYNASVVKTAPSVMWAVYWRAAGSGQALVSKYRTDTGQLVSTVDLGNLGGANYKPTDTAALFAYQIASGRVDGADHLYVTVRNESTQLNGVLRIRDAGGTPDTTVWGHVATYGSDRRPARLLVPPGMPQTVYCVVAARSDMVAGSRIYRFSAEEPGGTLMVQGGTTNPLGGAINSAAFDEDGTTLYYTQSFTGATHEPVVDFFSSGAIAGTGGFNHNTYYYGGAADSTLGVDRDDLISPIASPDHARDADIYDAAGGSTPELAFSMSLHLLNGFYLGEARLATVAGYPTGGGSGHTGHLFIFDPKACPYAPRVDEAQTDLRSADRRTVRARIFSPGFPRDGANPKSREGGFLASTITSQTVALSDAAGNALGLEAISYVEREEAGQLVCEIVARAAADLPSGASVRLTLQCGASGIKNTKGASLVNTRPDEFKDEITLTYTVAPEEGAPPVITRQPTDQTTGEGETATFSVTATGGAPLACQWQQDGVDIPGATGWSYSRGPTTSADHGARLTVAVSNAAGTVTSEAAVLTVLSTAPAIAVQPRAQTVRIGLAATFVVSAQGTPPLEYQWYKNSVRIPGATGASYTTPATAASDRGAVFHVMVRNAIGSTVSQGAPVILHTPPAITAQPPNRSVTVGMVAGFSVTATGATPDFPLAYQWRRNGVDIPGANSSGYLTPPVTAPDHGAVFSVVVSNALGTVTSANATLTVGSPPVILDPPASQTVNEGQTATFSVTATGTAPLHYQWLKNGAYITGASSASYTTPPVTAQDNGAGYLVVVSNGNGLDTRPPAILTVNRRPSISVHHTSVTGAEGQIITATGTFGDPEGLEDLSLAASVGTLTADPATGQWSWSDVLRDGPANQSITVTVTDPRGLAASTNFTLVVENVAPTADGQALTTPEDTPLAVTLTASDPGQDDSTFAVVAGPLHGTLSGDQAHLVYTPTGDWHGADSFTFRAIDSDNAESAEATVTIAVAPINDPPTAIILSPASIDENQPAGTPVGALAATDPDSDSSFVYSLVSGEGADDNSSFTIEGEVLTALVAFDRETKDTQVIRVRATDSGGLSLEQSLVITVNNLPDAQVVGRHVFYNQSSWDGKNAAANAADDGAIAPDKQALLPGQKATFANYTSYTRGINGIMIDVVGLHATPTVDDFAFAVGNNNDPTTWAPAPLPTNITVRAGAGIGGADRVTLLWPAWSTNHTGIGKQWLQVKVEATAATDLGRADVFYFGNAIGECGDSLTHALVNATDELQARYNPRTPASPAPITFHVDFTRDKLVNASDELAARFNSTTPVSMLRLITVPADGVGLMFAGGGTETVADSGQAAGLPGAGTGSGSDRYTGSGPTLVLHENGQLTLRVLLEAEFDYRSQHAASIVGPWHDMLGPEPARDAMGWSTWTFTPTPESPASFFRVVAERRRGGQNR